MPLSNINWLQSPSKNAQATIIAEIAQAHDGSLGLAHAYIDAAKKAEVDAVKFQTHIAAAESTPSEPWRIKFSKQDETRYEYWQRMEFTPEQWLGLKKHAEESGLLFLSSAFSLEAVELLEKIGVSGWKIASGEVTNIPMLNAIAKTRKPVIISSGMSDYQEIETIIQRTSKFGSPIAILQCSSSYPTNPEDVGLNVISEYQKRFTEDYKPECAIGLSDHSATIFPSLIATWLGAQVIETHLTISRELFGPDVIASLTIEETQEMVRGIRFIEIMRENPVDKSIALENMSQMRNIFMKAIYANCDLEPGTTLTQEHLTTKKPASNGIPAAKYEEIIGKKTKTEIKAGAILKEENLYP